MWFINFLLVSFLSLSTFVQVVAQSIEKETEQLLGKNQISENDLPKFRELASVYTGIGKYDSAILIYQKALKGSIQINNDYWQTKYLLWLAGIYIVTTELDSAKYYIGKSFPLIKNLKNDSLTAQYYQNLGTLEMYQVQNEQAAANFLKSIEIMEAMRDKAPTSLLLSAYINLSGIFNGFKQSEMALIYDKKALQLKDSKAKTWEFAALYFNVANTYYQLNNLDTLKIFLDSARFYNELYPNDRVRLNIQGGLGNYFQQKGMVDSALYFFNNAVSISREVEDYYFFTEFAINAASILIDKKKINQAEPLLNEALQYARAFNDFFVLEKAFKELGEIALLKNDFKEAYHLSLLSRSYADSASSLEIKNTILGLEAKYQNQRKESEIVKLELSNNEKELEVIRRNRILAIVGVTSLSSLFILGLFYRTAKQKQIIAEKDQKIQDEQIRFLERQQQVISLQSMVNGQETERTRIAKDLHDGLGGLFSTIKMHFSTLQHEQPSLKTEPLFAKSYEMVNTASEEVRRIAHNMMPEVLIKLGLVNATQELCNSISAGKLLQASLQVYGMDQRLSPSTEVMLFRILQELLNNIIKHSEATQALIQFNREGNRLSITVEDNGRGFSLAESDGKSHAGLTSVESRVNYLNGKLSIDSQKEVGTTVMMDFLIKE